MCIPLSINVKILNQHEKENEISFDRTFVRARHPSQYIILMGGCANKVSENSDLYSIMLTCTSTNGINIIKQQI